MSLLGIIHDVGDHHPAEVDRQVDAASGKSNALTLAIANTWGSSSTFDRTRVQMPVQMRWCGEKYALV